MRRGEGFETVTTLSSEASALVGWVSACTYLPNLEMDVFVPRSILAAQNLVKNRHSAALNRVSFVVVIENVKLRSHLSAFSDSTWTV